jgi:hypothetical protein
LKEFGQVEKREEANWGLHPLIHTMLEITLAPNLVAEIKQYPTSNTLSLS